MDESMSFSLDRSKVLRGERPKTQIDARQITSAEYSELIFESINLLRPQLQQLTGFKPLSDHVKQVRSELHAILIGNRYAEGLEAGTHCAELCGIGWANDPHWGAVRRWLFLSRKAVLVEWVLWPKGKRSYPSQFAGEFWMADEHRLRELLKEDIGMPLGLATLQALTRLVHSTMSRRHMQLHDLQQLAGDMEAPLRNIGLHHADP